MFASRKSWSVIKDLLGGPSSASGGFGMTAFLMRLRFIIIPHARSTCSTRTLHEPLDKMRQTFAQLRGRIVAEQFSRFGNVSTSQRNIARLLGQLIDLGLLAERLLDFLDQILELDGFAFAEIKNIEQRSVICERGHGSLNDVVDISVIAAGGAIAELVDWLAGVDFFCELGNGQVGGLTRGVNGV